MLLNTDKEHFIYNNLFNAGKNFFLNSVSNMLSILGFPTEKILATHTTVARQGHPQNHLKTKTNILHNIFFQKNIRRRFPDTKIPKAEYVRKMRLTLVDLNIGLAKLYFLHDG